MAAIRGRDCHLLNMSVKAAVFLASILFLVVSPLGPARCRAADAVGNARDPFSQGLGAVDLGHSRKGLKRRIQPGSGAKYGIERAGNARSEIASRATLGPGQAVAYTLVGGSADCGYTAPVTIFGNHLYNVILDTGSSIFAVATSACPGLAVLNETTGLSSGCDLPADPVSLGNTNAMS